MMFRKTNEEVNLDGLEDFIEKPSQKCNEEELKNGVNKVLVVLSKNPVAIMNIIASHPFIPSTFLLDDLSEKMNKQDCKEKLVVLFDRCLDSLVEACIYTSHDLERCINTMPSHLNEIMQNILSHDHICKRILEGDKNPTVTLKEIAEKYPLYKNQFSEFYNRHFNITRSFKS